MTICFLNSEKYWGGGEKWHFKMAELFLKDGYNVIMLTNSQSELKERSIRSGIPTKSMNFSKNSFLNPIKVISLVAFFRKNKVDAVFMNNPADLKIGSLASKIAGIKHIVYRRGMPHPISNTIANRYFFSNLTGLIAISEEVRKGILKNNNNLVDKEKIHLIYNAIDHRDYVVIKKKPEKKIFFGVTARLVEQKGLHHLIDAAFILKNQGCNFKVLIAGKGPLEKELKDKVSKLNLDDYVDFTGFVTDLSSFLNSIDVFVFPSYFEGSTVSIVEAIHFGKPIVAFNISTMPELVRDGYNGYLASFKDTKQFAQKMKNFIDNRELIIEMGNNSSAEAHNYDLLDVFNRVKEIIKK